MDPTTTNVDDRDQWRARINRALSDLQSHATHLVQTHPVPEPADVEGSADTD